MGAVQTCASTR